MTKEVKVILSNPETGEQRKLSRGGLNVLETLKYRKFLVGKVKDEEAMIKSFDIIDFEAQVEIENEALLSKAEYLAELFGVEKDDILSGIEADEFDNEWKRIMGAIDPKFIGSGEDEDEGK